MLVVNMALRCIVACGVYLFLAAIMIVLIRQFRRDEVDVKALWKKYFVYLIVIAAMFYSILAGQIRWVVIFIAAFGLGEIAMVMKNNGGAVRTRAKIFSVIIYLFFAAGFVFFGWAKASNADYLAFYTLIVVFDGFSQLAGQLFGKRKITPKLSPGKTWGGLVGGMAMVIITLTWIVGGDAEICAILGLGFSLMALSGDLLASKFKRVFGVKDFSNAIPGHGGVLDRFDSFIGAGAITLVLMLVYVWMLGYSQHVNL